MFNSMTSTLWRSGSASYTGSGRCCSASTSAAADVTWSRVSCRRRLLLWRRRLWWWDSVSEPSERWECFRHQSPYTELYRRTHKQDKRSAVGVICRLTLCAQRLTSDNAPIFSARSVSARWCTSIRFRARIAARGNVPLCIIARKRFARKRSARYRTPPPTAHCVFEEFMTLCYRPVCLFARKTARGARVLEQGGHGQFLGAHGECAEREPLTGVWSWGQGSWKAF